MVDAVLKTPVLSCTAVQLSRHGLETATCRHDLMCALMLCCCCQVFEGGEHVGAHRRGSELAAAAVLSCAVAAYALYMRSAGWFTGMLLGIAGAWIGVTIQHCGNHGAMSNNPLINNLLGLCNDLIGGSSLMWRYHHQVGASTCNSLHAHLACSIATGVHCRTHASSHHPYIGLRCCLVIVLCGVNLDGQGYSTSCSQACVVQCADFTGAQPTMFSPLLILCVSGGYSFGCFYTGHVISCQYNSSPACLLLLFCCDVVPIPRDTPSLVLPSCVCHITSTSSSRTYIKMYCAGIPPHPHE